MKIRHINTSFTENDLKENSPFVYGLHKLRYEGGNFHEVMLGYHETTTSVPFYEFSVSEMNKVQIAAEQMYDALYDAVGLLFTETSEEIARFFGEHNRPDESNFITRNPDFLAYAKYTYFTDHSALYGRFDMSVSPTGEIRFYEFNGDTPTMLFESSCVQDVMLTKVGLQQEQHNWWQEYFQGNLVHMVDPGDVVAVVAKMDITTDAMTAEYIYNSIIQTGHQAILMDFSDLMYDDLDRKFHYDGTIVNKIYILKPWEEMVEESPDIIGQWGKWSKDIRFFEPAWRWFTSNKGIWAYLTDILLHDRHPMDQRFRAFKDTHAHVKEFLIPSYMEGDKPADMLDYIAKPVIGRCSSSMRIFKDGVQVHNTGGWYSGVDCIVQQWTPPPALPGRDQFVTCMWMAPYDYESDKMAMVGALLTIRECKGDITDIRNESVYPCIVLEDNDASVS